MVERKRLVIDANILIRACLGVRARALIAEFVDRVDFFVAESNAAEAAAYISDLARQKNLDAQICNEALASLMCVLQLVEDAVLVDARDEALARVRDADDWPALALAMRLECAIWTEDQDFFGTGVATWTTNTVELYLKSLSGRGLDTLCDPSADRPCLHGSALAPLPASAAAWAEAGADRAADFEFAAHPAVRGSG